MMDGQETVPPSTGVADCEVLGICSVTRGGAGRYFGRAQLLRFRPGTPAARVYQVSGGMALRARLGLGNGDVRPFGRETFLGGRESFLGGEDLPVG